LKLSYKNNYRSITQFNAVELPDFTVLTGVNGSGKSHLLEAIKNGNVDVEGLTNSHVVLFSYENFRLDNEERFNASKLVSEREQAWKSFQKNIKLKAVKWREKMGAKYQDIKRSCEESDTLLWDFKHDAVEIYKQEVEKYFSSDRIRDSQEAKSFYVLAKHLHYCIDEIEHAEFMRLYRPYLFINDFLPFQLGKVFWDYYAKYIHNCNNELLNTKYGKNHTTLTEDDFINRYGAKPWEVVNKIFDTFDILQYRVTSPEGLDVFGDFQLKLKHIEKDNLEINFMELSSGEKVLMALVASIYKSLSDNHFPSLLLLDEIDTSLHPSMVNNMLKVIESVFLSQNMKVIMVTHSPTTIALAPEESVFVMNPSGNERIVKPTKQEALTVLTEGFATLEQGLRLFDQVSRSNIAIITEGNNTKYIQKLFELQGIDDVEVITGLESISGKDQIKTLFDFFSKVQHENNIIFIWDCDCTRYNNLSTGNNTYPFIIPINNTNTVASNGIENAFPESLFENFVDETRKSLGDISRRFDKSRKNDFANFVIGRNNREDFQHFLPLIQLIKGIRSSV